MSEEDDEGAEGGFSDEENELEDELDEEELGQLAELQSSKLLQVFFFLLNFLFKNFLQRMRTSLRTTLSRLSRQRPTGRRRMGQCLQR